MNALMLTLLELIPIILAFILGWKLGKRVQRKEDGSIE
jgi:hypothetical protein